MKAVAAKSSSLENAVKSQGKSARNQTQPAALAGIPLIQRKSLCPCDGGCPRCTGIIQPKLTVGAPDDEYEQEADRVADQVMRMPEPVIQRSPGCSSCGDLDEEQIQTKSIGDQITLLVQRQEEPEEEEEEEEEPVQAKGMSGKSPPVTAGLGHRIQSLKEGGQPLSVENRAFFEPRFGRDFSRVRVHSDSTAAALARSVNARAFTLGTDIVFNTGSYVPGTAGGKRLLAHELTHVVQQRNGLTRLQRTTDNIIECNRSGARACLVHMHGDEAAALETVRGLYCSHCTNMVHLTNDTDRCRYIRFEVTHGERTVTCCADANRIFDTSMINGSNTEWNRNWNIWNRSDRRESCGCNDLCRTDSNIKSNAFIEITRISGDFLAAIDRCRASGVEGQVLPVVAFHNNWNTLLSDAEPGRSGNRCTESLSIRSYCPGHCEDGATDQRSLTINNIQVEPNTECEFSDSTRRPILNPHIESESNRDLDDYYLVTRQSDFIAFVGLGRNVVLQSPSPTQDGSLSVHFRGDRYINIEAQRGAQTIQQGMGTEVIEQILGISAGVDSCPAGSGTGCPTCGS